MRIQGDLPRLVAAALAAAFAGGCCRGPSREAVLMEAPIRSDAPVSPPRSPREPLTVDAAVDLALKNYPAIRAARAREEAALAGIDLAETSYLPRLDLIWQELRATRNNFSGTILPNSVVPGISGAVVPRSWTSAWGSAAGVLLAYEPFDFGLRGSVTDVARANARQAHADLDLAQLDVAGCAAEAFLTLVAAQEAQKVADANVVRWTVLARSVRTLVDQQLRPGSDASRAEAELALARNQAIQADQVVKTSRLVLAESLGLETPDLAVDAGPLLGPLPAAESGVFDLTTHPLLRRQGAAVQASLARQKAINDAYYPKINLQAGFNGRGSGFGPGGDPLDAEDGLWPNRANWFAGVVLTFPSLEFFQLDARAHVERANEQAERARAEQIFLSLRMQDRRAAEIVEAARRISENTPVQLLAAREARTSAEERYRSGLGTLTETAEAQRLLAQAEIDDAVARLAIWRALAVRSRIQGDLAPFLKIVDGATKGKK